MAKVVDLNYSVLIIDEIGYLLMDIKGTNLWVLHHCTVVNIKGESYRLEERKEHIIKQAIINTEDPFASNHVIYDLSFK